MERERLRRRSLPPLRYGRDCGWASAWAGDFALRRASGLACESGVG